MSDTADDEPVYKRKRVAKACQTCRSMKSKCDGKQPKCGRCVGYGYDCVYSVGRPRRRREKATGNGDAGAEGTSAGAGPGAHTYAALKIAVDQYEALVQSLITQLPSAQQQQDAQTQLNSIKSQIDQAVNKTTSTETPSYSPDVDRGQHNHHDYQPSPTPSLKPSQRYLGEVSDVHFFNVIKRILQTKDAPGGGGSGGADHGFDSYEQDGDALLAGAAAGGRLVELPGPEKERKFTDVYFATIHLAYPFIPQSTFSKLCDRIGGAPNGGDRLGGTESALYYVICAIGSYYTSFLEKNSDTRHFHGVYFQRALALAASTASSDRSINQVSLLLTQCFYYLAVSRTDSCWMTLGQAVRIAQGIGLHVEKDKNNSRHTVETETRRRVWYSIYVLDRLLSLQLGRPAAVHEDDFNVPLPSRRADSEIEWEATHMEPPVEETSGGDYFLAVIGFSQILGRALREVFGPRHSQLTSAGALRTRELDRQLVDWKSKLPRRLRFDLGHAFDQNFAFKRQRNILAVKFHHLRALLHRPYLCYPLLRGLDDTSSTLSEVDWHLVSISEKTCVAEARETARLLHGVSSEKDLVHDFPWWQMISCLLCASSILLISSTFTQPMAEDEAVFDTEGLSDDAETCLKMFEALSCNSSSAKSARDMLKGLKECGIDWKSKNPPRPAVFAEMPQQQQHQQQQPQHHVATSSMHAQHQAQQAMLSPVEMGALSGMPDSTTAQDMGMLGMGVAPLAPGQWPAEIVDSMAWSAQFFDAIQGYGNGE
ncbi:hypothetical protein COL516b_009784 [Colletotrichum fioriniae]|nr:uncharacterized protein COL516b_009784 [Colletotrichum fioriniae]KAJ0298699.1 hypothetical protein COL516b_009784 [Colletotrichum fioriniae]